MACKDSIPVSIEYRRILFGAGTLIDPTPICKQIDAECCADAGDPTCCDGEYATNLAVTLGGPIDGACGDETVPFTLDWIAAEERWYGEATNAGLSYSFRVWFACVNGVYLGTVQILDPAGVLLEEGDVTLAPNADCTLLASSFVPDEELAACVDPITVEIAHPCPEACVSNGQRVPCCPDGYTETLSADIDTVGALTLVFDADFGIWQGAVSVGDDAYILTLWCNADGTWTGWIDLYTGGELIDSGTAAVVAGPDCTTLVGAITVQGETLTVEIVHPCTPDPCDPGGGGGNCCGMTADNLYATFGGSLAALGTVTMPFNATPDSYSGSSAECGNRTIGLTCIDGEYSFSVSSTDPWTIDSVQCSPFVLVASSPNSAAPCSGAATVTITDTP